MRFVYGVMSLGIMHEVEVLVHRISGAAVGGGLRRHLSSRSLDVAMVQQTSTLNDIFGYGNSAFFSEQVVSSNLSSHNFGGPLEGPQPGFRHQTRNTLNRMFHD